MSMSASSLRALRALAASTLPETSSTFTPTATETLLNTALEKLPVEACSRVRPDNVCILAENLLYKSSVVLEKMRVRDGGLSCMI